MFIDDDLAVAATRRIYEAMPWPGRARLGNFSASVAPNVLWRIPAKNLDFLAWLP
jgi:hypothetical protein